MKKNNIYISSDDIDLIYIIKLFWKEKILILCISMICGISGYLYSSVQPKEYKTEILIKYPSNEIFSDYSLILGENSESYTDKFAIMYMQNFLSLDVLADFLEQSTEFYNLKTILKSKNTNEHQYFYNKLGQTKNKNNNLNQYFLLFNNNEINGAVFLNNFADYVKKKTFFEFSEQLKYKLIAKKNYLEQEHAKAKIINLELPNFQNLNQQYEKSLTPKINDYIFYNKHSFLVGTKVLFYSINNFEMMLTKLEKEQFNYNHILEKASIIRDISKPLYLYYPGGLFLGFLFSFVIVFFKTALKKL